MDHRTINGLVNVESFNNIEMIDIPSPISRSEHERDNEKTGEKILDEKQYYVKIYLFISEISYALLHTFFLSIFEVIFYWNYVAIQERQAIINKTKMMSLLLEPVCSFYAKYNEDNFEEFMQQAIDTLKTKNETNNKNTSLAMSITLSIILFGMYLLIEIINYKLNKRLRNKMLVRKIPSYYIECRNNLWRGGVCLCFVSIYEAMFFQLVIVNFNPIDSGELMLRILRGCIT